LNDAKKMLSCQRAYPADDAFVDKLVLSRGKIASNQLSSIIYGSNVLVFVNV
jgi:hypothetical protein